MDSDTILTAIEYIFPTGTIVGLLTWGLNVYKAKRKETHDIKKDERDEESLAVSTLRDVVKTLRGEFLEISKQLDDVQAKLVKSESLVIKLTEENQQLHTEIGSLRAQVDDVQRGMKK